MITIPIKHPITQYIQENSQSCVMALGFFDGVHLGHQKIIRTAKKIAKDKGLKLAAMTFAQHPSSVIPKGPTITKFITPLSEKAKVFEQLGVDILYVVDFTKELAKVPHQQFVDQYIYGLNSKHVVAGFDYKYGFKGKGDMSQLPIDSKGRFGVTTVSKLEQHEQKVSSTLLRALISTGRVEEIYQYLGKSYEMRGEVKGKGRTCTFSFDPSYYMPIPGHYEVTVKSNLFQAKGMCEVKSIHHPGELTITFFEDTLFKDFENATLQWNNFIADFEMDALHAQGDLRELEMSM
ncbi:FMN adenylyltransferase /riboflavin kinase [Halobacillus alkaliphilus]|uniref:FAD synthase n=1 Tax=Halobacillus alkaliphilus TaxID=396056 RepID=A0A1I2L307_9BACI|nr:FAD synthetase family protein [Halobacillus alkaliphilus]SFF72870.1 FMN adenylyltransferase /riboflavin kinase [Halobacillus alkaliphilus]